MSVGLRAALGGGGGGGAGSETEDETAMCACTGERISALRVVEDVFNPDVTLVNCVTVLAAAAVIASLIQGYLRASLCVCLCGVLVGCARSVNLPCVNMVLSRLITRPVVLANELILMLFSTTTAARVVGAPMMISPDTLALLLRGPQSTPTPDHAAFAGKVAATMAWFWLCILPAVSQLYGDVMSLL
jgi:hypothetical protein